MKNLLIILGSSGTGKTTLQNTMVEKYGFNVLVSHTTRKPRVGEINGVDYHFINETRLQQMSHLDLFIESTKYEDSFYGLSKKEVENSEGNVVCVMEPYGAVQMQLYCQKFNINCQTVMLRSSLSVAQKAINQRGDAETLNRSSNEISSRMLDSNQRPSD